jgi:hypothetical protein
MTYVKMMDDQSMLLGRGRAKELDCSESYKDTALHFECQVQPSFAKVDQPSNE